MHEKKRIMESWERMVDSSFGVKMMNVEPQDFKVNGYGADV